MEPLGARDAHKLPRITGSNPGSKNISERPNRDVNIATVGAVAYINNMGGTVSPQLTDLAQPFGCGPCSMTLR